MSHAPLALISNWFSVVFSITRMRSLKLQAHSSQKASKYLSNCSMQEGRFLWFHVTSLSCLLFSLCLLLDSTTQFGTKKEANSYAEMDSQCLKLITRMTTENTPDSPQPTNIWWTITYATCGSFLGNWTRQSSKSIDQLIEYVFMAYGSFPVQTPLTLKK
jgi:hypothetical protein